MESPLRKCNLYSHPPGGRRIFPLNMKTSSRWQVRLAAAACVLLPVASLVQAEGAPPHSADKLVIESSSTKALLNTATLKVAPLARQHGVYAGSYEVNVSPVGFTSEKGDLTVSFPDEALRKLAGKSQASFHGEATNSNGKHRTIDGTAVPTSTDGGTITLKIVSERGKLVFHTTYHFGSGQ